jgi:tRNA A-37 threonylcarbamoyl transferase component Bud32
MTLFPFFRSKKATPEEAPRPPAPATPEEGVVVGRRFEVETRAARGGMGTIYKARDMRTGRTVALKVRMRGAARRFQREAQALAKLRHPAIVRYVAHGQRRSGDPFLAMEWLDGVELRTRLEDELLSVGDTYALALRISQALGAAHREGIVHRDVTPRNILLVGGLPSQAKLIDFGLVYVDDKETITGVGPVGTAGFVANDRAQGAVIPTPRLDVYSLGCVLFACLTGQVPRRANEPAEASEAWIPVELAWRGVPPALADLIERMIALDPLARPADGDAVFDELLSIVATEHAASAETSRPPPGVRARGDEPFTCFVQAYFRREDDVTGEALHTGATALLQRADAVRRLARVYGGRLELAVGGLVVVALPDQESSGGPPMLLRVRRCIAGLRAIFPHATFDIASCLGAGERRSTRELLGVLQDNDSSQYGERSSSVVECAEPITRPRTKRHVQTLATGESRA